MPGPARAGRAVGLRHQPPRHPSRRPAAEAGVLRRLPRAGRRLRAPPPAARGRCRAPGGLPRPGSWPPRPACCSPTSFATLPPWANRQVFLDFVEDLEPGVTELTLHPAIDTPELRAITDDWEARVADHVLLVDDRGLGRRARRVPASPASATGPSATPCADPSAHGRSGPGRRRGRTAADGTDILSGHGRERLVAEGQHSKQKGGAGATASPSVPSRAPAFPPDRPVPPRAPDPDRSRRNRAGVIHAMTFGHDGIGVIRSPVSCRGSSPGPR